MRIVSFSYFLPYDGVPHAGGEYYLRHVRVLLELGHEVTVVAPATEPNLAAQPPAGVRVVLVDEWKDLLTRASGRVARLFREAILPPVFTRAAIADDRVRALVRAADLLEYQWVPASSLHRGLLRRAGARPPAVCVAHDVVAQSLERREAQPGLSAVERLHARVRTRVGRWDERRQLRGVDLVTTFSEKDQALLARYGVHGEVVLPPLAPDVHPDRSRATRAAEPRLLFVGAFNRPENADAAEWLLSKIWPAIREEVPSARLSLVGAEPTEAMARRAGSDPRVEVAGYVEDLDPIYDSSAVAVVPLRLGAGVKFKVITAIGRGVPVIVTSIGAEGIAGRPEEVFVAVEDDADLFARAVVAHLKDPERGLRVAQAARREAVSHYGRVAFAARVDSLYRTTVRSRGERRVLQRGSGGRRAHVDRMNSCA